MKTNFTGCVTLIIHLRSSKKGYIEIKKQHSNLRLLTVLMHNSQLVQPLEIALLFVKAKHIFFPDPVYQRHPSYLISNTRKIVNNLKAITLSMYKTFVCSCCGGSFLGDKSLRKACRNSLLATWLWNLFPQFFTKVSRSVNVYHIETLSLPAEVTRRFFIALIASLGL